MTEVTTTRSPATVGYAPWVIHRATAVSLIVLLAVHLSVQVFGVTVFYETGLYQPLLDLTLIAVFTHGFLGIRATLLETTWEQTTKRLVVWALGIAFLAIVAVRLIG
ncbi:hypothetical protein [Haloarcula montana]|jgi:succinate dehydrogenase hydrophobic anchor subunit|uniref:hypothetical protein n=1 Tax=Haloarcula montana TaxID=3111776 RepID=UPI002D79E29B|nr:hypothetical protein [Haloarcula sp. GH36]